MTKYFCVVSAKMPLEMQHKLENHVDEIILLPPDYDLAEPVQCHPDMVFSVIDSHMFVHQRYADKNRVTVEKISALGGFSVIEALDTRSSVYPQDVGFNIAVWKNNVICRPESTSSAILEYARAHGYRIIPVKQGYTGCSSLVTDSGIFTSDIGIVKSLIKVQIPCKHVECDVRLPGYNCGFLGGASGYLDGKVYLCGKNSVDLPYPVISLEDSPLTDYGGIKFFKKSI